MPPQTTTPAPITTPNPTPVNPALFAQPGENFASYEARVAGANGGAAPGTPPGTNPQDTVAQSLGYKNYADATSQLTAAPTESETQMYNDAYSAAGLDQLQNTITGRQSDLATAQGNINDNPWLDEASRVGRNNTVTTLANADIKNYQDEYANKLKGVEDLVTRESADNTATSASNKAKLAALEAQAKVLATQNTATTKAATTAPKTVKGSTTGATYQWNPTTQKFEAIIPATPKTSTTPPKISTADAISGMDSELSTVKGSDGYISPNDWATGLSAWQAKGLPASSYISNFKKYANTADPSNNYTGLTKPK